MRGLIMLRTTVRAFIRHGFFLPLFLAACSNPLGPDRIPVVQLAEHSATIMVGDTARASLLPMLPPGYVPTVEWSSSDPDIASVVPKAASVARVAGLRAGEAVIHVAGEGARDSLFVTVIN
jgi:hypothetical protein